MKRDRFVLKVVAALVLQVVCTGALLYGAWRLLPVAVQTVSAAWHAGAKP
jgi:hypothetical protein